MNRNVRYMCLGAVLVGLALGGCGTSGTLNATSSKPSSPCPARANITYEGRTTYQGRVSQTKGAQLVINDVKKGSVILRYPRAQSKAWLGKTARATGDLCIKICGPREQCLMSGSIEYLLNVELTETP